MVTAKYEFVKSNDNVARDEREALSIGAFSTEYIFR